MIYYDEANKRFELHTQSSCYVMEVDADSRLNFVAWGGKPRDLIGPLNGHHDAPRLMSWMSQESFKHNDEFAAWGDESLGEPALDAIIPKVPHDPQSEAAHFPVRDLRLRYLRHRIGGPEHQHAGAPQHGRPVAEDDTDWLIIECLNQAYPLRVSLHMRPRFDHDIIERYIVVQNDGDQDITLRQLGCALQLPRGTWQATSFAGAWGAEFGRQCQTLPMGITNFESRSLNTGICSNPSVILQKVGQANRLHGETFATQLAWSGNWRIACQSRHDRSLRVIIGEHPHDAAYSLSAGEQVSTPLVLAGRSENGEEGIRSVFQSYHEHCTMPQQPLDPRPVLYNSWEATYFDLSVAGQIKLAQKAAEIGVELFVVDDGWFGGRRSDHAGLGDWQVSDEVFPTGMLPLIEEVHRLGMKFGIWFEPEMVNPDSDLYRAHPDWVLHYPSTPRLEARNQLILDFGNPQVVAHIQQQMEAFLDHHPVDFIKWDMNRAPNAAGSLSGEHIWRRHVEALYGIMDRLLAKYPQLVIQSCSSGGGRVDAGILARCAQVWTSDNTDALSRVAIQDGYAAFYPISGMECWVTHELNHQTNRQHKLDLRFAAAMRGVLGIGSHIDQLDEDELSSYTKLIAFYKSVRHLVQHGLLHRPCLPDIHEGLSVWQFTAADGSEAYVNAIITEHRISSQLPQYYLAGLQANTLYDIFDENGTKCFQASGAELMNLGLGGNDCGVALAINQGGCWHYHIRAVKS